MILCMLTAATALLRAIFLLFYSSCSFSLSLTHTFSLSLSLYPRGYTCMSLSVSVFCLSVSCHDLTTSDHKAPLMDLDDYIQQQELKRVLKDLDDVIPPESQWKAPPPVKKRKGKDTLADGEMGEERPRWKCHLLKAQIKQEAVKSGCIVIVFNTFLGDRLMKDG